jgi:hypothetical protein
MLAILKLTLKSFISLLNFLISLIDIAEKYSTIKSDEKDKDKKE